MGTKNFAFFGHSGPGNAGLFGALMVGWLVVMARGLYLARHHDTYILYICQQGARLLYPQHPIELL